MSPSFVLFSQSCFGNSGSSVISTFILELFVLVLLKKQCHEYFDSSVAQSCPTLCNPHGL